MPDRRYDSLGLKKATRPKLTEVVAQQLLEAIRVLPEGARVPSERELIRELGVGRSTLREALHGLALLGEIEIRHGKRMAAHAAAMAGHYRRAGEA